MKHEHAQLQPTVFIDSVQALRSLGTAKRGVSWSGAVVFAAAAGLLVTLATAHGPLDRKQGTRSTASTAETRAAPSGDTSCAAASKTSIGGSVPS